MGYTWQHMVSLVLVQQVNRATCLQGRRAFQNEEKLLRFVVVVARFLRASWCKLLDHTQAVRPDQMPAMAVNAPVLMFCIFSTSHASVQTVVICE